ncbi:beta barrel domain-containing protein [Comamonas thiooxydans]|uniref:beta barrel domain-containing protein n=1 Tax=Comamonas thiooxydans TaxID=363952 RepID=UPI000B4084C8|nr:hypothetical protein [Comamonas thiooxydans]
MMSSSGLNPATITVGQALFVASHMPGRRNSLEKVAKIGRKYIVMESGLRFDKVTLAPVAEQGYSHRIQLWGSKAAYEEDRALRETWLHLRTRVQSCYKPPPGLTVEAMAKLLAAFADAEKAADVSSTLCGSNEPALTMESAEALAFASTNEPTALLRHWFKKGFSMGAGASATPHETAQT